MERERQSNIKPIPLQYEDVWKEITKETINNAKVELISKLGLYFQHIFVVKTCDSYNQARVLFNPQVPSTLFFHMTIKNEIKMALIDAFFSFGDVKIVMGYW